ncbi:hypothetical protein O982_24180 [Mycobacterium avium 10-5581]|nr:hypothetical protein O982_24180 [Mycobacterium avium 10-5581]
MALTFDPEAADRWRSLCRSTQAYEVQVRDAVATILRSLAQYPQQHRVGAIQFLTTPTTWARTVAASSGASWLVAWTVDEDDIRVLRIEPAPSF